MSKDDLYLYLIEKYGYTPEQIADMNPNVQYILYRGPKIVTVNSLDELQRLRK